MARTLTLTSLGGSLVLDGSGAVRARAALRGTGLPPVALQWFEGAGDGAEYRSARVLPRTIDMPVKVTGVDRAAVWAAYSALARILDPANGPATLEMSLDGVGWFVEVYRSGGGDLDWDKDTDGRTIAMTVVTLVAGDPYWRRVSEESRIVTPGGLGQGLLSGPGALSGLEVSTTTGLGTVTLTNTGDVAAFPVWRVTAPFTDFTLTSPTGQVLAYTAAKASGWIEVNTRLATVVDEAGANQYANLDTAPEFWTIPPGSGDATVAITDPVGGSTEVSVYWRPRKWLVF